MHYYRVFSESDIDWVYWKDVRDLLIEDFKQIFSERVTIHSELEHVQIFKEIINKNSEYNAFSYNGNISDLPFLLQTLNETELEDLEMMNIRYYVHPKYPNLIHLRPIHHRLELSDLEKDCFYGLVVDIETYKILCNTYRKLDHGIVNGNVNEKINFNNLKIYDKLNGIRISLYYYEDHWQLMTEFETGTILNMECGQKNQYNTKMYMHELFWNIWNQQNYKLPTNKNLSYHFYLVGKENRYISHYVDSIVLYNVTDHGINTNSDINNIDEISDKYNWECVNTYTFTKDELLDNIYNCSPWKMEGYVIKSMGNLYYIASPRFISAKYCNDLIVPINCSGAETISDNAILDLVRKGFHYELREYYPHLKLKIDQYEMQHEQIVEEIINVVNLLKNASDGRSFSKIAIQYWFKNILFHHKNCITNFSVYEYLSNDTLRWYLILLEKRNNFEI
eukprot:TRINITY_DN4542_c0_g1_i1.p1 TRINITY_DN4542_c0_g1~~TRINITY_DN4542_c0_g1_i1.p1  ORF type:complete len:450 (+),score=77.30 TRINITY_DN4542_c0_g1_i1:603-1952(+)